VKTVKTVKTVVKTYWKTRDNRENRAIGLKKRNSYSFFKRQSTVFTVITCFAVGFHNGFHGFHGFHWVYSKRRLGMAKRGVRRGAECTRMLDVEPPKRVNCGATP